MLRLLFAAALTALLPMLASAALPLGTVPASAGYTCYGWSTSIAGCPEEGRAIVGTDPYAICNDNIASYYGYYGRRYTFAWLLDSDYLVECTASSQNCKCAGYGYRIPDGTNPSGPFAISSIHRVLYCGTGYTLSGSYAAVSGSCLVSNPATACPSRYPHSVPGAAGTCVCEDGYVEMAGACLPSDGICTLK